MQTTVPIKSLFFILLLLISFDSQAAGPNQAVLQVKDDFLVQFAAAHNYTSYDGKQFIFSANPSIIYMFLMGDFAFLGLGVGLASVHFSFKKGFEFAENDKLTRWAFFLLGSALAAGGAVCTKLFFDAINMKIKQIEYIKFDDVGIYKWGQLQTKWKDVSNIYLSKIYYNDVPRRKASFSDKRLNDLFVIDDNDFFLPLNFDDFLSVSEYYLNKFNPVVPRA